MSATHTLTDLARAVLYHDRCPTLPLCDIECVLDIALRSVIGLHSLQRPVGIDLGNGHALSCQALPAKPAR